MPICKESVRTGSHKTFKENIYKIVEEFDNLDVYNIRKPRVGLVGEILVKFHPQANNNVVDIIEKEGAEAVMPDLTDFLLYCAYNENFKYTHLSGKRIDRTIKNLAIYLIEFYRRHLKNALEQSKRFTPPCAISELAEMDPIFYPSEIIQEKAGL